MSILAISVTTVTCDGAHGLVCPERSTAVYHHPLSVATRLARKAGWVIDMDATCPQCLRTNAITEPGPNTGLMPLVPGSAVSLPGLRSA